MLTKIATTPYETGKFAQDWKMVVVRHNNTYFLCEFDTELKLQREALMTEQDKRMTFGGYKFEQYVVASSADTAPDLDSPIDNRESFCSVVRTRLGSHRLLFAGEVDCFDTHSRQYLELKTSRKFTHPRQEENFHRFKTVKWWTQSFLIGIERIVVGFRDDRSIVHELKSLQLQELAADQRRGWHGSICMNFLNAVLTHIRTSIREDDKDQIYVMEWVPGQQTVQLVKLNKGSEEWKRHRFMPDWFISGF